ncbi:hypothetical protein BD779DRAFT_347333 [Infundibulicybe gibba]|nr:hypothetical protein BD779DRAFT_347333 [Infundibulicybe gibba]
MRSHATIAALIAASCALCGAGTPATSRRATRGELSLAKRFDNAQLTFYSPDAGGGLGACGEIIHNSDFIVALNTPQYQASTPPGGFRSTLCDQSITITVNGKTATAKIMDECPFCPDDGLDLTPALFSFFAPLSSGLVIGSWNLLNVSAN